MEKKDTPNFEQLIEWLEGRLSPEEAQHITEQVTLADATIQADVAWLRAFYKASQRIVVGEPPTAVSDQLEQRFAAFAQTRQRPSRWQSFLAALSFDSYTELAMGVRTAVSPEDRRQMIFTTDVATVVCTLQRHNRHRQFDLLGQVLPTQGEDATLIRVLLLKDKDEFDSTITDDLGEFILTALPAGLYDLVLSNDQYQIIIPPIDLSL